MKKLRCLINLKKLKKMKSKISLRFGIFFKDEKEYLCPGNIKGFDTKQLKRVKPKVYTVIKGLESDGILKFGDLILKLGKYKINNLYDFCKAKNKLKWNSKIDIQIKRQKEILNLQLKTKSFENWKKKYPVIGVHVEKKQGMVVVSDVRMMSSALPEFLSDSTLKIGDIITSVDDKSIKSVDDYLKSLENLIPDRIINFKFIRGTQVLEKNIKIINFNDFIKLNRKFCKEAWPKGISSILVKEYEQNDFYLDEKYKLRRLKKFHDKEYKRKAMKYAFKAIQKERFYLSGDKIKTKKRNAPFDP